MKNLKVFINPGVHPQFKEITNFPPEGVEYYFDKPKGDHNSSTTRFKRILISFVQRYLQIPRIMKIKEADKYDLIHSTRGILIRNKKPWIVDIESGSAFSGLDWVTLKRPIMRWLIRKYLSSPYCKKIMPQSEASKRSLLENVNCSGFEDKIEILYLAYHTTKLDRKKSDKIRISFIGRNFFEKGGNEVQQAFEILNKKYPNKLQLKMKTNVPTNYKLNMQNVIYLGKIDDPLEFYFLELDRRYTVRVRFLHEFFFVGIRHEYRVYF